MIASLGILLLSLLASTGFGVHEWWKEANANLDRLLAADGCAARMLDEIRTFQYEIIALNGVIEAGRVAVAAATLAPQAREALMTSLRVARLRQDYLLIAWKTLALQKTFARNCPFEVRASTPLPTWRAPFPPDLLGPHPLHWRGRKKMELALTTALLPNGDVVSVSLKSQTPCELPTGLGCSWTLHWGTHP